ncbi:extracellular solute-binding protein [Paenibacillus sp. JDR-2]|uniref:extracellular solute-binding protein n=1 Tax=Paenibacillus sp. (strain JDR-2) TaxID=324057 RepID=UPI00016648C0|nr:extracellular solute-binding protein [Paenibacillus sp. JDR-2]ACT03691.1 extracellular solute-binding protein family 1 [Paenibacillus sp. JDR-2]
MKSKRWNKAGMSVAALTLGMSLIAGCGGNNTDNSSSASPAVNGNNQEASGSTTPAKEPVKVKFMNMWAKDSTENVAVTVREQLAKFQADNPDIIVEEESIGDQNAYYTKLKTLAASNDLPDIFISKGSELAMFAQNETAAPLDEVLSADTAWKDGFLPTAFNDLTSGGHTYGVPFSMLATSVIYYNKQIFADAGIVSFPKTWAELQDAVDKLKAKGITPIALGNKEQWVAESCILSALGDRFTGTDWFNGIINKSGSKFTDPDFVKGLTALQDLAKQGAFNADLNSINNDQQKTLYFNGKAAMFMEGSWAIGAVASAPKEVADNTDVAVLPSVEGGKGNALATSGGAGSGYAVGIKGFADKKDAIAKVIKAISGEEFAKGLAEKGEPVAFKVADYDKSKVSPLAVKYAELSSQLQFTPIYDSYLSPALVSVLNADLQALLINAVTPEELAKKVQAEYEKAS